MGRPITTETTRAEQPASGSVSQKLNPACVTRMAET
jgi:hypothetical protein